MLNQAESCFLKGFQLIRQSMGKLQCICGKQRHRNHSSRSRIYKSQVFEVCISSNLLFENCHTCLAYLTRWKINVCSCIQHIFGTLRTRNFSRIYSLLACQCHSCSTRKFRSFAIHGTLAPPYNQDILVS